MVQTRRTVQVIYTGGTIGMVRTPAGFVPSPDLPGLIAEAIATDGRPVPEFTFARPFPPIDSAEAMPGDWYRIALAARAALEEADGVVILHGTDTMAYAAAALSLQLGDLARAIVLTGSQIPFGEEGSDALDNMIDAVTLAADPDLTCVAVAFGGRVLLGCRVTKQSSRAFEAFASPNSPDLATRDRDGRFHIHAQPVPDRSAPELAPVEASPGLTLTLRVTPGLPATAFRALSDLHPAALLLECYGLGTAPTADGRLAAAVARATSAGIVVAVVSQCAHGGVALGTYAAGAPLIAAGAISAGDMSFEMAFVKLTHLAALGLPPAAIAAAFQRDLVGERTPLA